MRKQYRCVSSFLEQASSLEEDIIDIRRAVHQNPELSYDERETSELIKSKLKEYGIRFKSDVGGYGVVGLIEGRLPSPCIGLRADMDALPLNELTDVPFRSMKPGLMHACGHDTHVAMLLGAARIINMHKNELNGSVKLIFQPAEEDGGIGGALPMIEAGVMENPKVDYIFGLHITSDYPSGSFALRPGPIMAAPDLFKITIHGKGGHGSAPHQTVDPIFIGSQLVTALQGVRSRNVDPREPFVLSVCSFHSGSKNNIIPDEAILEGTIRTFNEALRRHSKVSVSRIAKKICSSFGARCDVEFKENAYPVTVNDKRATARVQRLLRRIPGARVMDSGLLMGAEDFSRFLQKAPGVFYFLGTYNSSKGCIYPNHSSRFSVDESVLKLGTASLAEIAFSFVSE